jgi:hypothetical protein
MQVRLILRVILWHEVIPKSYTNIFVCRYAFCTRWYEITTVTHCLQLYSLTRTPNTECILPLCFVLCVYDP